MSKLIVVSGRECIRALEIVGFFVIRQKGSHVSMIREEPFNQIVVPNHKELDRGTLRAIIRQAGLSVDEFNDLLKA